LTISLNLQPSSQATPNPNPQTLKGIIPGSDEAAALSLDPLKGNVAFSAAQFGWSFTLDSFAGAWRLPYSSWPSLMAI